MRKYKELIAYMYFIYKKFLFTCNDYCIKFKKNKNYKRIKISRPK